ncbi:ABC transporter permease [Micromonospora globispora]|uniref:ABC transporter permease n=1 Tax=Micromonospora globispora TaxID=1450148 RepID=UPI000D6F11D2|nr:ABC transporter permease [Micromonospora globispora]PWU55487.1 ABC transporter permease [Micromonospora globispora]RQW98015.1 ABC transporter permease [Micromonospora globispora]
MQSRTLLLAPDASRLKRVQASLVGRRPWVFAGVLVIALLLANAALQGSFLDPGYWPGTLGTLAPFVLVAFASTVPVLGGGIDISVGPLATLVNCLLVATLLPHGLGSPLVAIPILLAVGAAAGCINGLLIVVGRLQPVIATLAMFFVLSGLALHISPAPVPAGDNWTRDLAGTAGPLPGGLLTIGAAVLIWVLLGRTQFLRNLYAVGGDDVATFSAGVNVAAVRIGAYVLSGVFATIAGVALTAVIQTSQASLAASYSLIALAAVSLGGTSLAGGRGGLIGSLLGAAAIFLLQELLAATGVPTSYVQLVYGLLLIAGVVLSGITSKGR